MSDFLFIPPGIKPFEPRQNVLNIYPEPKPKISSFSGNWGSCYVAHGPYRGYDPVETERYVMVVLGGPVLYFRDNSFLGYNSGSEGTRAVLARWRHNRIRWDNDISGPFAVMVIDKITRKVTFVTDLMSFIPLYSASISEQNVYSSHVDLLARTLKKESDWDITSLVDFSENGTITYPYTSYNNIMQIPAASIITSKPGVSEKTTRYWHPDREYGKYRSAAEASDALRTGIREYIARVTASSARIGHFVSGGEDSRAIAGLLPANLPRDGFIFLDRMNREGGIAKRVCHAYGSKFTYYVRHPLHYLHIMPDAVNLVGSGHQYIHAHALHLHTAANLSSYAYVFGGFSSDALLKGLYIAKKHWIPRCIFLPTYLDNEGPQSSIAQEDRFDPDHAREVLKRRKAHSAFVASVFGREIAKEYSYLWPASMREAMPNFFANRRLFSSFEPFMCNSCVKISASIPAQWKINRRLFHKAMKPCFSRTGSLLHGNGYLPYYSVVQNIPVHGATWFARKIFRLLVRPRNEGPWTDWQAIQDTPQWQHRINEAKEEWRMLVPSFPPRGNMMPGETVWKKVNIIQIAEVSNSNRIVEQRRPL